MADNKTLETGVDKDAVQVNRVEEQVQAQVAPPREPDSDTVDVHEVSVTTDVVITDPTSPLAVQTEGGGGSLDLPIHLLDRPSPEQVLAGEEAEPQDAEPTETPQVQEDPDAPTS